MAFTHKKEKDGIGSITGKSSKFDRTFFLVIAPCSLLCILAVFFYDVLFLPGEKVLSKEGLDLFFQFVFYRDFGFSELRKGNLALWNPHLFSGIPFLGGFQSGLLYPLNMVYLILPLAKAINVGIILNLFFGGMSMYLWTAFRGLHPFASLFSAILFMFCGPHFLHIYAGHLPNLCVMAWAPLVLLAMDGLAKPRPLGWCLLGIFAVTMQLLAGHPQYFFYMALTSGVYCGLLMIRNERKIKIILGLFAIYASAAALSAVQLMPAIQTAWESVRSGGLPYRLAAMFSFPPENFVTLLVPGFFGDMESVEYWGRCYLWEMSFFIGIGGFALSILGATYGGRDVRRFSVIMVLILTILAIGVHAPIFGILYSFVPGFDKFRGSSKFIFFASLYLIMLAGIGFDNLIKTRRIHRNIIILSFTTAFLLAALTTIIWYSAEQGDPEGLWARVLLAVQQSGESDLNGELYVSPAFAKESGLFASRNLLISSGICALLALNLFLVRFSKRAVYLIAFLTIAEILYFAKGFRPTFDLRSTHLPGIESFAVESRGDHRILNLVNPNSAMTLNMKDIWGYDPGVSLRYAQFMTYTQGGDPEKATSYIPFSGFHRLYKMLRCRYVIGYNQGKSRFLEIKDSMPKACLVDRYRLIQGRDHIFEEMSKKAFDLRKTVILENRPAPEPVRSNEKGTVKVIDISTDQMIIEADLSTSSILLITDAYSGGWRVHPLPGSVQQSYQVMPANYVLRAIPLGAGHHHLLLEYEPLGFQVGKWISIVSAILYVLFFTWYLLRHSNPLSLAKK